MNEHGTQNQIRTEISKYLYPLCGLVPFWRINVGQGWTGNARHFSRKQEITVEPGDVLIKKARTFNTGAPEGFSDLIGAVPTIITPEMIGQQIAVFSAIEVKTETGKSSAEQKQFIANIQHIGGRAGVARSPEDAIRILRG
ncbi:VRR-NUC domain-containing protein [Sporomusa sphaeroides]|uniref:VRR-NUC domain-containing protein n=1 Tax=Sporomusa sphaeroides TaxID=47679 RepID=UPI003DA1B213